MLYVFRIFMLGGYSSYMKEKGLVKRAYRYVRGLFERSARSTLEKYDESKIEKYAEDFCSHYRSSNAWWGVIGPIFLGLLYLLVPNPDSNAKILGVSSVAIYYSFIIIATIIVVILFSVSFLQKDVWTIVLSEIKNKQENKLIEKLKTTEDENNKLILKNRILEEEKDRLLEFMNVTALIEGRRNKGEEPRIQECIILLILQALGTGEYSVGLYHSYNKDYKLDEYDSTKLDQNNPSCLGKIISKNNAKYQHFFSTKCLFEKTRGQHCIATRDEVKEKLVGDIGEINQYACYNLPFEKKHNILLEIIAYNDTSFKCEVEGMDAYFDGLFKKYMPIIKIFIKSENIKEKFSRTKR